ncbi:MAG: AmmeMemoRadiSam system protein A [Anaerolineae bacterium]|nr:AmmeMemoRadiSam system protein A [Anaerolineae bacterium]
MGQEAGATFKFTHAEKRQLLEIARAALTAAVNHQAPPTLSLDTLPPALRQPAACFVTLHIDGALRGCTGSLTAQRPLVYEVSRAAIQTAMHDPRFSPVTPEEVPLLDIEISVLTPPEPLPYDSPEDLCNKLRPGIDGVTLRQGNHRATFLPQVWQRIPEPAHFLSFLSRKMGLSANAWRNGKMQVEIYQTLAWSEAEFARA